MQNDTIHTSSIHSDSATAKRVFERIDAEAITPTPKLSFVLTQWGIWLIWLATVLFGAVALAVSGYVTLSAQYALYEATHENFVTFFVAVMPYIWMLLFALMTYVAVYEIRKTKHGYRYSTSFIIGSNLLCTVLGALLLHSLGMGYALDKTLGEQIAMYMSMDKMEQRMWQMPEEGRLVGVLASNVAPLEDSPLVINFKDVEGVLWRLSVAELTDREQILLSGDRPVRLLGTTTSDFSFHVCGVFPWLTGKALHRREMIEGRQQFDALMHDKMDRIEDWAEDIRDKNPEKPSDEHLCAHLPVMNRMR